MAVKAKKLRERLNEWQTYIEQPQASPQDAHSAPEGELFDWSSDNVAETPAQEIPAQAVGAYAVIADAVLMPAEENRVPEHIESQLAEMQAQLESERIRAQQLAEKLANEVIRSRQSRLEPPKTEMPGEQKIYREPKHKFGSDKKAHDARSIQLLILALLVAGVCSLLAFTFAR